MNKLVIRRDSPERYVEDTIKYVNEKKYEDAMKCYYFFCLRTRQDVACSSDPSNSAANNIKILVLGPFLEKCIDNIKPYQTTEYYLEIAKQVKNNTEEDKLDDPRWVNKYGMSVFTGETNTMYPQHQWKQIRLQVINDAIDKLSN